MANRTIQILGQGFGPAPAQITVTANGNAVFSGSVSTVNQPVPVLPNLNLTNSTVVLCDFEIDQTFSGQMPMTCTVDAGTVVFAQINANYVSIINPVYNQAQLQTLFNPSSTPSQKVDIYTQVANPPLSQIQIDALLDPQTPTTAVNEILITHNLSLAISSGPDGYGSIDDTDPRSNVAIDGVPQVPDHGEMPGTWWWIINNGSTLSYTLTVDPALL